MVSAMKEYYNEVMTPGIKWLKKHWIGYLVYIVICFVGSFS